MKQLSFAEVLAIKAGDVLMLKRSEKTKLETVIRVTPTQIICTHDMRFYRVHNGRRMYPGRSVSGFNAYYIERVATPQDIARIQDIEAREQRKRQEREEELERQEAKRRELSALFPVAHVVYHDSGNPPTFEIHLLSEAQVRKCAEALKEV